jgi:hypothetical protein
MNKIYILILMFYQMKHFISSKLRVAYKKLSSYILNNFSECLPLVYFIISISATLLILEYLIGI